MKFRVFDRKLNKFADPEEFFLDLKGQLYYIEDSLFNQFNLETTYYQEVDGKPRYIVEMFSGFCDENGKEIYEGDIITNRRITGEVKFGDGVFTFCESEFYLFKYYS